MENSPIVWSGTEGTNFEVSTGSGTLVFDIDTERGYKRLTCAGDSFV